jgi:hypothetical protein
LLVAMLATALPTLALAGSGGRRNTALGLSGLAAYELLNGHTTVGALSAAGALYAWSQYSKARRNEKRQARVTEYYRSRYYSNGPGYSRVRGYRGYYSRGRYGSSGRRRRSSLYAAGYRAGYRRGVRVCRTQHRQVVS